MKGTESENKKKRVIGTTVGILFFAIAYLGAHFLFTPSIDEKLNNFANEINKGCPIVLDEFIQLDSTTIPSHKNIKYNYTLIGLEKGEINLDTIQKYIEPAIIDGVRNNPGMKEIKSLDVIFIYSYHDIHGELAYELVVTPEIYNSKE